MKIKIMCSRIILAVTVIIMFGGCGKDETVDTEESVFLNKISGGWTIFSVTLDGNDVSKSFSALSISISQSKQIVASNPVPPIWNASSIFALEPNGSSFIMNRDDGVVIFIDQPSEDKLILSFQYDPSALGGRRKSVAGQFTFELIRP